MGWSTSGKHGAVMNCNLPLCVKRKVYNQYVLPVFMFSSENWHLTKGLGRNLWSTQMKRKMFGITWREVTDMNKGKNKG